MSKKKPSTGYDKKNKKPIVKEHKYLTNLIIPGIKKISITERIIKLLIYIALRLVIKPSKWKRPEKNYELIDRIYKRLTGTDLVFIPSSIAYYIIIAFMPILSLIILFSSIPFMQTIFDESDIRSILGKFIPGIETVIAQASKLLKGSSGAEHIGAISGTVLMYVVSIWIASGGFSKLIYTQSYIYGHKFVGGWWMNKIKGMGMVISLALVLLTALMVNIQVNKLIDSFHLSVISTKIISYIFLIIGLFILLFTSMIFLFKFSPRFKIKFKHVLSGAMVTALPTTLFLTIFAAFSSLLSYSAYGILSVLMYVGLVSLWTSVFLFLGIITNSAYYKTHVRTVTRKKWTISKK